MAKWPYNTTAWQKLRAVKLAASPICEHCADAGKITVANTVDHIMPISEGGSAFPPIEMLASLCRPCHSAKTARGPEAGAIKALPYRKGCNADGSPLDKQHPWGDEGPRLVSHQLSRPNNLRPSVSPLTILFGPPGAGKTTYAQQHMKAGDVLLDLDIIAARLACSEIYEAPLEKLPDAIRERNRELQRLANVRANHMTWLIVSGPDPREREWWVATLKPTETIILAPPIAETVERIKQDKRRGANKPRHIRACYAWYAKNAAEIAQSCGSRTNGRNGFLVSSSQGEREWV